MPHLKLETIARLVDETPDAAEQTHLDACSECRHDLEDMRADAAVLASMPMIEPSPDSWRAIETRLAAEGLITRVRRVAGMPWQKGLLQAAAAAVLFVVGAASGMAWTQDRPASFARAVEPTEVPAALRPPPSLRGRLATAAEAPAGTPRAAAVATTGPSLRSLEASSPLLAALISGREPATPEEAALMFRQTEALYLDALTRMAELAHDKEPGDPFARLAALEGIMTITREALGQAPADPVLNGYHLTAIAQRDATLKQLAATTSNSWF
jgi:hypothetical protein